MKEQIDYHPLTESEVLHTWEDITGQKGLRSTKNDYLKAAIGTPHGPKASFEMYPDYLNGKNRLVLRDFSAFEGDHDYLDGVQMVAGFVDTLKSAGINVSAFEVTPDYSDADTIKTDVEVLLANKKEERAA